MTGKGGRGGAKLGEKKNLKVAKTMAKMKSVADARKEGVTRGGKRGKEEVGKKKGFGSRGDINGRIQKSASWGGGTLR